MCPGTGPREVSVQASSPLLFLFQDGEYAGYPLVVIQAEQGNAHGGAAGDPDLVDGDADEAAAIGDQHDVVAFADLEAGGDGGAVAAGGGG